ncbi:hypothetical protein LguiB_029840 [Lonicera macranthoides]
MGKEGRRRRLGKKGCVERETSQLNVAKLVQRVPSPTKEFIKSYIGICTIETGSDVLPEVLRHSLPSKIFQPPPDSTLSGGSKWALSSSDPNNVYYSVSPDALNPLRAYVSLPQVTFGPKRWQLPNADNTFQASTANDLRRDKYTPVNPDKLKAAAAGLSQIGKAFAVATTIVFGGAALMFGVAASKLELHNGDDIRTKGKDLIHPRFEMIKEQVMPLRTWAEGVSKKWHWDKGDDIKEKPLIKELSKILGPRTSN